MQLHFRVRSVLLSAHAAAVTLQPVDWIKDDPSGKMVDYGDGVVAPEFVDAAPGEPGAEAVDADGKLTELRFDAGTDLRPGHYLTMTVERVTPAD